MARFVVICAALLVGAPLSWLAGEKHRETCLHENRAGCSVLPWVAGVVSTPGRASNGFVRNGIHHWPDGTCTRDRIEVFCP